MMAVRGIDITRHIRIGGSHPPRSGEYTNKNAQLLTGHFYINDGGEGGLISLGTSLCLALRVACSHAKRRSCRFVASLTLRAASQAPLSNWHAPVVDPPIGDSHPPRSGEYTNKNAQLLTGHFYINDGGEGGIRTPDTLPYTHFPGVLLQPLGHLTKFLFADRTGSTGRYYREFSDKGQGLFSPFFLFA